MGKHFFLMGRSHLSALWFPYHHPELSAGRYPHVELVTEGLRVSFLQLEAGRYEPLLNEGGFHPGVREAIHAARADVHVSVLGGNDHSMIGVVRHPPLFDFVLPEAPEAMLPDSPVLVPTEMVRADLTRRIAEHVRALELLREAVPEGRIIHVESPPPLPEAHIMAHPVPFGDEIAAHGIAPALLRWKLWRLHSALYQEVCARLGIEFQPSPPAMRDAAGIMLAHGCHPDATHGSDVYGSHVLAHLLERAA